MMDFAAMAAAMAAAQSADRELQNLKTSSTTLKFIDVPLEGSSHPLTCDSSTGTQRPYVPRQFRYPMCLHSLSHPGIRATQHLITSNYVWSHMNTDVRNWTRNCVTCQRNKVHRHTIAPLSTFVTPDARLDDVHIDLVGPLPPSDGFTYQCGSFHTLA